MILLSLESATKNCAVGLIGKDGLIDSISEFNESYSHAEKLHVFIDDLLKRNNIKPQDLSAVVVNKGPGSYTGLRIGVSAAKGLCYALSLPMIAIDSLSILCADAMSQHPGYDNYIPMIDAKRMEVYTAVFNAEGKMVKDIEAAIIDEQSFADYADKKVLFFGDGASKCKEVLKGAHFDFGDGILADAPGMVVPATEKFKNSDFEDVAYFEPFYLKDFIAGKRKDVLKSLGSSS
jgi:tRNA threonylcarbamoyladenosine biosynthesis protein TsaB